MGVVLAGATPAARAADDAPKPAAPPTAGVSKPEVVNLSADTSGKVQSTPLMALLEAVGPGKALKTADIMVTGYVDGSWTYDSSSPPNNIITGRVYDTKAQSLQLDQLDLTVQRKADYAKPFDVGFQIEQNYGRDSAYFHANGLLFYSRGRTAEDPLEVPGAGDTASIHPKAQYDLTLANFTLSTSAVAKGLSVRVGKFPAVSGAEGLEAYSDDNQAPFFSRSYIFTQEPYTKTGVVIELNPVDTLTVRGGVARGWNQSVNDNNGSPDYLAQAAYKASDELTIALNSTTGKEEPRGPQDGFRTVIDLVVAYKVAEPFTLGVNGMYAWEPQTSNGGAGGGTGQWYAVAAYASFRQSPYLTVNARGEWFDDQDGAAPRRYNTTEPMSAIFNRPIGAANTFTSATLGATIHPLPDNAVFRNLAIRPEVRFDYADHATWDAGTDRYRVTAAVEAFYAF